MSPGTSPSTATRSSADHSVVCGRHGPVRYGWSSSSGSVDRNLPITSTSISGTHHETDGRRRASTDVQRAEGARALDLVVTRRVADLQGGINEHPDTGRPDGMATADQPAAGVDRQPPATGDVTVIDCLPRLAGRGEPDVVDREVLARREAVVHLEPVDVIEREPGPIEGILHRCPQMWQDVGIFGRTLKLLPQPQPDGTVTPPLDPCHRPGVGMR